MVRPSAAVAAALLAALSLSPACSRPATPAASPSAPAAVDASGTPAPDAAAIDVTTPLPSPLPRVAATVNGEPIAAAPIVAIAETALTKGLVKDKLRAYRQTLNQFVERELLLQEALRRRISPDPKAIEQAYDLARVPYPDDAAWATALRSQGFTPDGYRAELRAKQTVDALLREEAQAVPEPTEAEIREFYDRNQALFEAGDPPRLLDYEEVRDSLGPRLWQERREARLRALLERLRAEARIERFL